MVCDLNIRPEGGHYPKVDWGGEPVGGGWFPKTVMWKEPAGNPPPDFDRTPTVNVSERAKQVIERLEPGVHEFVPVEYLDRRGIHLENRYWFVPGNCIDSLDRGRTTFVLSPAGFWVSAKDLARRGKPIPHHIDPEAVPIRVFSLEAIGAAKIWRDKRLDNGTWLTDEVARALHEEGLTGIRLHIGEWEAI